MAHLRYPDRISGSQEVWRTKLLDESGVALNLTAPGSATTIRVVDANSGEVLLDDVPVSIVDALGNADYEPAAALVTSAVPRELVIRWRHVTSGGRIYKFHQTRERIVPDR